MGNIDEIGLILEDRTEKQIGAPDEFESDVVALVYADADADESRILLNLILDESERSGGSIVYERREQKAEFVTRGVLPQPHFLEGGFSQGETEVIHISFGSPVPAASLFTDLKANLLKWLENKKSRRVKLKHGEVEIEVKKNVELDALFEELQRGRVN